MHHLEFRANAGDLVQLSAEQDVLLRAGAVEQRQFKVLDPVADRSRHGEEGRDAGAAGETNNLLFVPKVLIVEETLGRGGDDLIAQLFLTQQPIRRKAAGIGAHRDRVSVRQGFPGRRAERVCACDKTAFQGKLQGDVLSGAEIGQGLAVLALEHKGFGGVSRHDLVDRQLQEVRVQGLRVFIDGKDAADFTGGRGLDRLFAGLAHVLELEHVELADQSDLHIQLRHYLSPPSHSFKSFRALAAIS